MEISKQATKGHLYVGAVLVLLSLGSLIAALFAPTKLLSASIFFFGVWGCVEIGRYLEHWMSQRA